VQKTLPGERIRRAVRDYAASEMPASRDLWPTIQRRLQEQAGPRVRLVQARPQWVSFALAATIVALLAITAFAFSPVGQYFQPLNPLSPTSTQAAAVTAAQKATGTPQPSLTAASFETAAPANFASARQLVATRYTAAGSNAARPQLTAPVIATWTAIPVPPPH